MSVRYNICRRYKQNDEVTDTMTAKEFADKFLSFDRQLYRVAFYILESEEEAKDALQDLYLKLWNSRAELEKVENPNAYCLTLIRNLCIDRLRKSENRQTLPEDCIRDSAYRSDSNPERILEQKEAIDRIMKAIEKLPPGQREILTLRVLYDLPFDQIEKITGLTNLSLRVTLSRALKKLRMCNETD